MIEGIVPKFHNSIRSNCTLSDSRGTFCVKSHVNVGRSGSLDFNSFRWRAICLLLCQSL